MNCNIFLAGFIALLAVNVSNQSSDLKGDSMKNNLLEELDKVLIFSTTLLKDSNKVVDTFEKESEIVKNGMMSFAVKVGTRVTYIIVKGINTLREGATADGKAVIDCIFGEHEKTMVVINKFFGDIASCAADEVPKLLTEIRIILKQLGDLKDKLQGETDTLRSCSDSELKCLLGFDSNIIETNKNIKTDITRDVMEIRELIRNIAKDIMANCAGKVIQEFKSNAQEIFNERVVCIKK